jgi:hypothetical protein
MHAVWGLLSFDKLLQVGKGLGRDGRWELRETDEGDQLLDLEQQQQQQQGIGECEQLSCCCAALFGAGVQDPTAWDPELFYVFNYEKPTGGRQYMCLHASCR